MHRFTLRAAAIRSVVGFAVLSACVSTTSFAADTTMPQTGSATTRPASSRPSPMRPTPEQAAIIRNANSRPIDEPFEKLDLRPGNNGQTNPHFGQPDQHFLAKHEEFIQRGKSGPIGVLFLGDSITEGWSGGGRSVWAERYDKLNPANFGIGGDATQHVLWRIDNGELDGISPKVLVFLLGTNNVGAPGDQILTADTKILKEIHEKLPETKVLLLAIFPRGADPKDKNVAAAREKLATVNAGLAKLDDGNKTRYLDIGDKFLNADGVITRDIMPDALHPNAKGYQIWADAMQPLLDEMMK